MKYTDVDLSIQERIDDLLSRMTIEEKIAQTITIDPVTLTLSNEQEQELVENGELINDKLKELLKFGIGSLQMPGKRLNARAGAIYRNKIQKYIMENTRLRIPALSQEECLNGHMAKGSTMFPKPLGLAGTFDTELVRKVYSVIGKETRARGGHQAFTPVLDVGRDPRWGRIEETFGEDTYLVTQMGLAAVQGLQGSAHCVKSDHVISTPKHFAGYAQVSGGRNFAPSAITERQFLDEILPPFEAAVKEGKCMGIMPSHSEIDGIPCHGNKNLLSKLLKEQWGFEGIVVSDYNDVERLNILHHITESREEAAALALEAGVDMDLPSGSSYKYLKQAIEKEPELMGLLDDAVRRILKIKFELGLFENPYVDINGIENVIHTRENIALSRKAAEKTVILLKNVDEILPLKADTLKRIAVIGPTADPVEFGYYSTRPNIGVSILDGIKEKLAEKCEVVYEEGCRITTGAKIIETETENDLTNPQLYTLEEEETGIQKAVELAKNSDVAIVCLGGSPNTSREAVTLQNHYGDNASLDLVGQQNELLKRILQTGTPVIVVLINGKPLSCGYVYENVPAVLEAWYLGEETGHVIADVLLGEVNPGGRLPVTIVRNSGFLPGYYSQKSAAFLKKYLFEPEEPYFWFGHGLSYTKFLYNNLRISKTKMKPNDTLEVSVDIKNIGETDGDEVVQMYLSDPVASVTRPERELKDFKRIFVKSGSSVTVTFKINSEMLLFTGKDYTRKAEAGLFYVHVGRNCRDTDTVSFELII